MIYSKEDVLSYVGEEDVKFIRLAFCDVFGVQKNISIMPGELERAFRDGISFDGSAICGFAEADKSDLFLFPEPSTLSVLPWRPSHGRVIRMFCSIRKPDGKSFESDTRYLLKKAVADAKKAGISCNFGAEFEFYLFKTNEQGEPTDIPFDNAGYMDVAPDDKGENVRREICLTLEEMDILPESSHHEEGPGQHEIDFRYSDALTAADNALTFKSVVKTIAARNGLWASFSPKPIKNKPGNGLHINISVKKTDGSDVNGSFMAGIMRRIKEITAFLNTTDESFERLGNNKAPKYITWSHENRSQLIRIPAANGEYKRIELRSADCECNPYLAFALLIEAGLEGVNEKLEPEKEVNLNLYLADAATLSTLTRLPKNLGEAINEAANSDFVKKYVPDNISVAYGMRSLL